MLWTGKDFVIIDFEGEPARSLGQRRLKRPAVFDLAGMIRSFHYASRAAAMRLNRDLTESFDPAGARAVADPLVPLGVGDLPATPTSSRRGTAPDSCPPTADQLSALLDFFLLEKAVYELGYEANSRPDWVDIPAQGILDVLDGGRDYGRRRRSSPSTAGRRPTGWRPSSRACRARPGWPSPSALVPCCGRWACPSGGPADAAGPGGRSAGTGTTRRSNR